MKKQSAARTVSPSRAALLAMLIGLCAALAVGLRLFTPSHAPHHEGGDNRTVAQGPNSAEARRRRRELERENRLHAYSQAQDFARAELLPHAVVTRFPDNATTQPEIIRLMPHRYRVRSRVTWRDRNGSFQQRRFETDLQHGPADSRWRLVDVEFLDSPPANPQPNSQKARLKK